VLKAADLKASVRILKAALQRYAQEDGAREPVAAGAAASLPDTHLPAEG
jgi:hypothetical protein